MSCCSGCRRSSRMRLALSSGAKGWWRGGFHGHRLAGHCREEQHADAQKKNQPTPTDMFARHESHIHMLLFGWEGSRNQSTPIELVLPIGFLQGLYVNLFHLEHGLHYSF